MSVMLSKSRSVNSCDFVGSSYRELPDEATGPAIRKIIVIKRNTPDGKVVFYQKFIDYFCKDYEDPITLSAKNSHVQKKYANRNKTVKNHLEETLFEVFGKVIYPELPDILSSKTSGELLSGLFVASAYTVQNYFGKPGPRSANSNDLLLYIDELFPLGSDVKNSSLQAAKLIAPPKFYVDLFIIEASGLSAVSDLSYLYCKAWISSEPKAIEITKPVGKTERPVWKTRFFFALQSLENDVITIEMWKSDEDFVKNEGRKSSIKDKIFKISSKSKKEEKGLIGKFEFRASDIYSEGMEEWISLVNTETESRDVFLHVIIKFRVFEPESRVRGIKRHIALYKTCLQSSLSSKESEKIASLSELLSCSALTFLFLHSVISCLRVPEDIVCKFVVFVQLGIKTESFSYKLIYLFLQETVQHVKEYPNDFMESTLQLLFDSEMENLQNFCFKFISSLYSNNVIDDEKSISEFEFALRCLYLCQEVMHSVSASAPLRTLKSEAVGWLETKASEIMAAVPENRSSCIVEILDCIMLYQRVVDQTIRKLFPDETLTGIMYQQLDDVLCDPLKFQISELSCMHEELIRELRLKEISEQKEFVGKPPEGDGSDKEPVREETDAESAKEETDAESSKEEADAQSTKEETDAESAKAETDVESAKKETDAEPAKEKTDAEAAKEETDAQSTKEETDAESAKEEADAELAKKETDAESAKEEIDAESAKEEADAESAKKETDAESAKEKIDAEAAKEDTDAESTKEETDAEAAKEKTDAESAKGEESVYDENRISEEGIQLFSKLKELVLYISKTVNVNVFSLRISMFRGWFGIPVMMQWFRWRKLKAEREIKEAVMSDDLKTLDLALNRSSSDSFKESVSARQMQDIILNSLKELWILLSFLKSSRYDVLFVSGLHECCVVYADLLMDRISTEKFMEQFSSEDRKCLSVISNNVWLTAFFAEQAVLETVGTLPSDLPNTKLVLGIVCEEICSSVIERHLTNVERVLKDILGKEQTELENCLASFTRYMKSIIWEEVFVDACYDVFIMFLKGTCNGIRKMLRQKLEDYETQTQNSEYRRNDFFSLLIKILAETKKICIIPNDPGTNELIWGSDYMDLLSDLEKRISQ